MNSVIVLPSGLLVLVHFIPHCRLDLGPIVLEHLTSPPDRLWTTASCQSLKTLTPVFYLDCSLELFCCLRES